MPRTRPRRPRPSPSALRRPGFTLVELLVVIVILAILVALLVPVISGAVGTARDAQVTAEITILAQSLASFNSKYGFYPPSRIVLHETLSIEDWGTESGLAATRLSATSPGIWANVADPSQYFSSDDITFGNLVNRSRQALRKMFPRLGPTIMNANPPIFHNFNGNIIPNSGLPRPDGGYILLDGAECLAFFLGGVPQEVTAGGVRGFGMVGFSKDPAYPFKTPGTPPSNNPQVIARFANGDQRTQPFFEFKSDRLLDDDGDGIPGYVDTLDNGSDARYYAYFSAYGNNGYDPNDCNLGYYGGRVSIEDSYGREYVVSFPFVNNFGNTAWLASPAPNPYTSSDPVNTAGRQTVFFNGQTFQIISAGRDRAYGPGGLYDSAATDKLPADAAIIGTGSSTPRVIEKDNLTNFNNNRLD